MTKNIKDWAWKDIDWKNVKLADIKKVIRSGADVNETGWDGYIEWRHASYTEHTPLELAVRSGKSAVVKYLLEHGADPNVVLADRSCYDNDRYIHDFPLLSAAIETRNQKMIDLLFQYGANPYAFDPTQKPKKIYPVCGGGMYINSDQPIGKWTEHPIAVAIWKDNLSVLRKITSAPYVVPKACVENITCLKPKNKRGEGPKIYDAEKYWAAFVNRETEKERKNLRPKLAIAHKNGDAVLKRQIVEQLLIPNREEMRNMLNSRYDEAERYKKIKREYDYKTAIAARNAVLAKRAQILGQ